MLRIVLLQKQLAVLGLRWLQGVMLWLYQVADFDAFHFNFLARGLIAVIRVLDFIPSVRACSNIDLQV